MPEPKKIQLAGFRVAVAIASILCLCFAMGGGAADESHAAIELQSKINPNDAPAASLARLPGIGIIKANAIVEYRLRFQNAPRNFDTKFPGQKSRKSFGFHEEGSGSLAFQNCSDLDNVKGIGPITIEKMCEWLRFK